MHLAYSARILCSLLHMPAYICSSRTNIANGGKTLSEARFINHCLKCHCKLFCLLFSSLNTSFDQVSSGSLISRKIDQKLPRVRSIQKLWGAKKFRNRERIRSLKERKTIFLFVERQHFISMRKPWEWL